MRVPVVSLLSATIFAIAGCNSILGIDDHPLASSTGPQVEAGLEADAAPPSGLRDSALPTDGSPPAGEAGTPGGPVAAFSCAGDGGSCVFGGIFTGGLVPGTPGVGSLPGGGVAAITDDGFEFGSTACDSTGKTCVTGAIAP